MIEAGARAVRGGTLERLPGRVTFGPKTGQRRSCLGQVKHEATRFSQISHPKLMRGFWAADLDHFRVQELT